MELRVMNVNMKNLRPGYANLRAWMECKENLYVGRGRVVFIDGERYPKEDSPFCNPFKIGRDGTRAEVLQKFRDYIWKNPVLVTKLMEATKNVKILGCWCKPEDCHADILREVIHAVQTSEPTK